MKGFEIIKREDFTSRKEREANITTDSHTPWGLYNKNKEFSKWQQIRNV